MPFFYQHYCRRTLRWTSDAAFSVWFAVVSEHAVAYYCKTRRGDLCHPPAYYASAFSTPAPYERLAHLPTLYPSAAT